MKKYSQKLTSLKPYYEQSVSRQMFVLNALLREIGAFVRERIAERKMFLDLILYL